MRKVTRQYIAAFGRSWRSTNVPTYPEVEHRALSTEHPLRSINDVIQRLHWYQSIGHCGSPHVVLEAIKKRLSSRWLAAASCHSITNSSMTIRQNLVFTHINVLLRKLRVASIVGHGLARANGPHDQTVIPIPQRTECSWPSWRGCPYCYRLHRTHVSSITPSPKKEPWGIFDFPVLGAHPFWLVPCDRDRYDSPRGPAQGGLRCWCQRNGSRGGMQNEWMTVGMILRWGAILSKPDCSAIPFASSPYRIGGRRLVAIIIRGAL